MDQTTQIRLLKFSGVGVVAFLVDVEVFQAAIFLTGMSLYVARLVSFVVATSAAWLLNRTFTFHDANTMRPDLQWARFFAANLAAGALNYAVFVAMIAVWPLAAARPVIALAFGSLCAVSFNFTTYQRYVFRPDTEL
jgi:putative flippase GtrA